MKTDWLKILLILLLIFTACRRSDSPRSGGLGILNSDQTKEAVQKINEANGELKRVRAIYRESETQRNELREAMNQKEVEKVKKIATELVAQISEGTQLGVEIIAKIEEAGDMNINETYKEYLDYKAQALRRQLEAFEIRFDQVKFLRDEFQVDNTQEIEKAKARLEEMDEKYGKKMEDARDLSRKANEIYKDSFRKGN
jgi:hypothetical protein